MAPNEVGNETLEEEASEGVEAPFLKIIMKVLNNQNQFEN